MNKGLEMASLDSAALGERIRERREKLGLTQRSLAGALQVSAQAASKWERGESVPDVAVLVDLARLLGVSVDWLVGSLTPASDVIEATVLLSDVRGYGRRSDRLSLADGAAWLNGQLFQLTEAVVRYDGVVVKYMGDGTLAFFAGADHRRRALRSAVMAKHMMGDGVRISLHSGDVYVGRIGHPDHARMDILGPTVNIAASLGAYSGRVPSYVVATGAVVEGLADGQDGGPGNEFDFGPGEEATFKFTDARVTVHELRASV